MQGRRSNDIMDPELWRAATSGDANFIEEVVQRDKTRLLRVTIDGNSALHIAAKHGKEEIARKVSEAQPSLLTLSNKSGDTPLHLASAAGHPAIVTLLIHQHGQFRQRAGELCITVLGLQPVCPSRVKNFLAQCWTSSGCAEGVRMATIANSIGNTALHAATIGGHLSVVDLLLSTAPKLATMTNRAGVSALYMAAERGLPDIVQRILQVPAEAVSHKGPRDQMALHAAVLNRSVGISRLILEKNPSCLTHPDASFWTPLHFAAANGDVAVLRLLLQRDATAGYMQDFEGFAIIHIAASVGDPNMIQEILEHCPDALEQKNWKGRNFVHVAVEKKNLKVVEYVLKSPPSAKELLNEQDHKGNTPCHLAVLARDPEMIEVLLSSRIVDSALRNSSGFTPVDLASSILAKEISPPMSKIMTDLISYGSPFSSPRVDDIKNHSQRMQDDEINQCRLVANNLLIIAVLIATVTFAAAFTIPGGYKNDSGSDEGKAILSSKASLKAFLISDTVAMVSSLITAVALINFGFLGDRVGWVQRLMYAISVLQVAIVSMGVAFASGVYSVIDFEWVAMVVITIVACGAVWQLIPLPARFIRAAQIRLVRFIIPKWTPVWAPYELNLCFN
ncbi:uncharacterized protein LOC141819058 [Curcuma longa]|uniref:uncharacterized protein LOC141819058 n=1 Tax=Curcuma longa TaxID=136217 RepID=UPI003D9F183F